MKIIFSSTLGTKVLSVDAKELPVDFVCDRLESELLQSE